MEIYACTWKLLTQPHLVPCSFKLSYWIHVLFIIFFCLFIREDSGWLKFTWKCLGSLDYIKTLVSLLHNSSLYLYICLFRSMSGLKHAEDMVTPRSNCVKIVGHILFSCLLTLNKLSYTSFTWTLCTNFCTSHVKLCFFWLNFHVY